MNEIHILCGLPGAGKTHLCNQLEKKNSIYSPKYRSVHVPDLMKRSRFRSLETALEEIHSDYRQTKLTLYLDGNFHTPDAYELAAEIFSKKKLVFDYWEPDLETCTWNNRLLVGKSTLSLKDIPFEKPNLEHLRTFCPEVKIEIHHTQKKTLFEFFKTKYGLQDTLESDTWSLGGQGRDYTGRTFPISADPPIMNFDQFDQLLEVASPNISFLQYKRIYNQCVKIEERDSVDYYSDCIIACYVCDVRVLCNLLDEYGMIDHEKLFHGE